MWLILDDYECGTGANRQFTYQANLRFEETGLPVAPAKLRSANNIDTQ